MTYYWVRTDANGTHVQPRQTMTIASGDTNLHTVATDRWTASGSGSEQLVFVSPSYPLAAQNFICAE